MNVLHVITSLETGGAEKLIVDSIPLYQEKGVKVDVLTLDNHSTAFRKKLEEASTGKIIGLTLGSVYNPFLIFKIIPFLKRYDIIHAHLFPVLYWVVFANFFVLKKAKIVYTEHSTNNNRRKFWIFKILDRIVYRHINFIGCISEATKINLEMHLKGHKNIKTILNGINLNAYSSIDFHSFDFFDEATNFRLIQVSSFRAQKDQQTLIRSLKFLPENIKVILVGDGEMKPKCEQLVKELGLIDRVIFLGKRPDVPALLKYADVAIQSSNNEGFGLAAVEAMASMKPCIASNIPGLSEIVGNYGLLFEKGNSEALAKQVLELYNNKEFYKNVSQRCYERAQEFDIRFMIQQYMVIYEKLIHNIISV